MITAERKMTQVEFDSILVGDVVTYRLEDELRTGKVLQRNERYVSVKHQLDAGHIDWVYQDNLVVTVQQNKVDKKPAPEFKPLTAVVYMTIDEYPSVELKVTTQKGFDILVQLLDNLSVCHVTLKRYKE
jgi:hypothetical protein